MNFTEEERQCITRLLCEISHADGKFDLIEGEAIKREMNVDNAFINLYSKVPFELAIKIASAMSDDKKTEFTRLMYKIIMADGIVDSREIAVANIFLAKMDFTKMAKWDSQFTQIALAVISKKALGF